MQNVEIVDIVSTFQLLISGVPKDSILGPNLFNIFLNNLAATLQISSIYNFPDDTKVKTHH